MSTMDDTILCLFASLPVQGPGSDQDTVAVLDLVRSLLPPAPSIVDFGCGTGRSTIALAQALPGACVRAIDLVPLFVDRLRDEAERQGLAGCIRAEVGDMLTAPIEPDTLDLIWSEGAAYATGFETALRAWRPLLRADGLCVLSECEWLTAARPIEAVEFWQEGYPSMGDRAENVRRAEAAGYAVLHRHVLSEAGWSSYYDALSQALAEDRGGTIDPAFLRAMTREIAVKRASEASFGYTFYVLQARRDMDCREATETPARPVPRP